LAERVHALPLTVTLALAGDDAGWRPTTTPAGVADAVAPGTPR
jgi:hypothetical protein